MSGKFCFIFVSDDQIRYLLIQFKKKFSFDENEKLNLKEILYLIFKQRKNYK